MDHAVNMMYCFYWMILISAEYVVYIMCVCYFGDCRLVFFIVCVFVDSFVIKIFQLKIRRIIGDVEQNTFPV